MWASALQAFKTPKETATYKNEVEGGCDFAVTRGHTHTKSGQREGNMRAAQTQMKPKQNKKHPSKTTH
jgi:hypothetical protein